MTFKGSLTRILIQLKYLVDDGETLVCTLEKWRDKRSLNANAYLWKLIGELADTLRLSKEEVYERMLFDYGQSEVVSVRADIEPRSFEHYRLIGEGEIKGTKFNHYRVAVGSSHYNSKEMAILIDGVVSECEALGIPTYPEEYEKEGEQSGNNSKQK